MIEFRFDDLGDALAAWFCDAHTPEECAALDAEIDRLRAVDPDVTGAYWWDRAARAQEAA